MSDEKKGNPLTEEERDAYSRLLAAYGLQMFLRVRTMKVLIVGLQGLGVETAKDLILSCPKGVTLHDPTPSSIPDLGLNFFLSEEDAKAGTRRDVAIYKKMRELNPSCEVNCLYSNGDDDKGEWSVVNKKYEHDTPAAGLTEELVSQYKVVIFCGSQHKKSDLLRWNKFCREYQGVQTDAATGKEAKYSIGFICASTFGACGYVFSDYGDKHRIFDADGQPPITRAITHITNDKEGLVTIDEAGEFLQDVEVSDHSGWFEIKGVNGMEGKCPQFVFDDDECKVNEVDGGSSINQMWKFNGKREITNTSRVTIPKDVEAPDAGNFPTFKYTIEEEKGGTKCIKEVRTSTDGYNFHIGDTSGLSEYQGRGVLTQVKMPIEKHFKSLEDSIRSPTLAVTDYSKFGRSEQLHFAIQGIYAFAEANNRLPSDCKEDIDAVTDFVNKFNDEQKALPADAGAVQLYDVPAETIANAVRFANVELQPMAAFFGGVIAQEAMKWTGKFSPLNQYLYMDAFELIQEAEDRKPLGTAPLTRYDHQLAFFGKSIVDKLHDMNTFMVGCGALGCEYLKNFALMGVGCDGKGQVHVTDDDIIAVSNLNRQFLFRQHNVGHFKAEAAGNAVGSMNSSFSINAHLLKVMPATEDTFNDEFWQSLDFVTNALDSIKARNYVDSKCVWYELPLLESGTQATMCNGLVVLPHETPSYNDGTVAAEVGGGIPMCTLKNFPNLIDHCVEWSRAMFTDLFESPYEEAEKFAEDPEAYLAAVDDEIGGDVGSMGQKAVELENLAKKLTRARGATFEDCVKEAYDLLYSMHYDNIRDLTHQYPEDAKTETGAPFWSGSKRFPNPVDYDPNNELVMAYLICVSNLLAVGYGLQQLPDMNLRETWIPRDHAWRKPETIIEILKDASHEWTYSGAKADVGDGKEEAADLSADKDRYEAAIAALKNIDVNGLKFQPADFEKDCDANFHIDYVAHASNLRAVNYQIDPCDRDEAKLIAGRIIPAILTATASVVGLMCLELYKLALNLKRESFRNSSNNLATNAYNFSEPGEVVKHNAREEALKALERDEKSLERFLERPHATPDADKNSYSERNILKVIEMQNRIKGARSVLKSAREVPVGFTKWSKLTVEDTKEGLTVDGVRKALETQTGKIVSALSVAGVTLYDANFSERFEKVATGLAQILNDAKQPAGLRATAAAAFEAHSVKTETNSQYASQTMLSVLQGLGGLLPKQQLVELGVTIVDNKGSVWDTPTAVFKLYQRNEGKSADADAADDGEKSEAVSSSLPESTLKRVRAELALMAKNPPEGCILTVGESGDMAKCVATIAGPEGSPYEGGTFSFAYKFKSDYPSSAPDVHCNTKIYHCNIDAKGHLCGVPQLKDAWSPALNAGDVIVAIKSLLAGANFSEPLNADIAALYKKDPAAHDAKAAETTRTYATVSAESVSDAVDAAVTKLDKDLLAKELEALEAAASGSSIKPLVLTQEEIEAALDGIEIVDDMGDTLEIKSWKVLDEGRHARFAAKVLPQIRTGCVVAITPVEGQEQWALIPEKGAKAEQVQCTDAIMMMECAPADLVEYCFEDGEWMVSSIGEDSLASYRGAKFGIWEEMIKGMWKQCLASFRRLILGGVMTQMFDDMIFKEPEGQEEQWQVVNDSGRVTRIPHAVKGLRRFNPETGDYVAISTHLDGAPEGTEQCDKYWQAMLQELKDATFNQVGADFIDDCLNLDEEAIKAKYI